MIRLREMVGAALGYVLTQLVGGALGALALLAWGRMGEAIHTGFALPAASRRGGGSLGCGRGAAL
jgi:hypothetical protein